MFVAHRLDKVSPKHPCSPCRLTLKELNKTRVVCEVISVKKYFKIQQSLHIERHDILHKMKVYVQRRVLKLNRMIRFQITHQSVKSSQGDIQRITIVELRQPSVQKDVSSLGLIKHVSLNISEFGVPKKVF